MASSFSLQLKQSQSLAMSPQLMELMRLIAMNHLELSHFIAQEVEENPLLEVQSADEAAAADHEDASPHSAEAGSEIDDGLVDSALLRDGERLSDGLDADFANVFPDDTAPQRADAPELLDQWKSMPGAGNGEDYDLDDFVAYRNTPRETLSEQIPFALGAASDRRIAQHLIDQLDDTGYLHGDLAETAARLGVAVEDMDRVLHVLQQFDPPGIFARTLGECLAIQLRARNRFDPAMEALVANLELLARRDFASLKKICGVDEEDLIDMHAEIRRLDPKPGTSFEIGVFEGITPDVVVRAAPDGGWSAELSSDDLPRVRVKHDYFAELSRSCGKNSDQDYFKERLERANWLERSLDDRARTIRKVADEIVRQQQAFLAHGLGHLRPLILKTVADAIDMSQSTVSRVTSNKYMQTPRGVFELKYFFTASIGSADDGDAHSAESARHRIRTMINQESAEAVLSDDAIVDRLKKEGVKIARRTVAKYREAMNIPSSFPRRREKRALAKAKRL
ncbi:RNA polymerase factor sigma-54 [Sinorhizobium meliloti]|uniref:RNA polymerase factor sigma-54 n=1 Tax=Rhizobium meliloti TaxID=382 RepID=UPI0001E4A6F2|nr:RNA polymerase factor sigma-54 [Sinorhizobium meliloti]AEG53546.1 RNA polymerase, sigma 54 subunit, RpoN [Sinorhizobium meliloti AK83]MDE4590734.1 RNA polymerase factor sigma-54 [Sinorhizobium meliloti]SEJ87533.1 RNA polymerase, sigma 54 subunit, RpoN/SigL [Sinorhizobium meliloti]SEJ87630.1 RNA polymerase, sigma 54 subunit, RpoN/SigL [Sinorhizobium meliloti]